MINKKSANIFARKFLKLQREHWGSLEGVSRFKIFSQLLKIALEEKLITFSDFDYDDDYVIRKLVKAKNVHIKKALKILSDKRLKVAKKGGVIVEKKKFRHTNPKFLSSGVIYRLSEFDKSFRSHLEKERAHNKKGIIVPEV